MLFQNISKLHITKQDTSMSMCSKITTAQQWANVCYMVCGEFLIFSKDVSLKDFADRVAKDWNSLLIDLKGTKFLSIVKEKL